MKFEIVTDSGCNLPEELIEKWHINVIPMSFMCEGRQYQSYLKDGSTDLKQFYTMMRNGKEFKTSLASMVSAENILRGILDQEKDLLYLGFSSGLSSSFDTVALIISRLASEYPERTVAAVDSLAASAGQGMLVVMAAKKASNDESLESVCAWLEENKLNCAHWFTVDDLAYLMRGGRISKSTAFAGSLLNAKPIMHVDDNGKLVPVSNVRGRKKSIRALVDHVEETALQPVAEQEIFIAHGDCIEDAEALANEIKSRLGAAHFVFNYIDPVIGAHSGPGTLAVFFMAKQR